MTNKLLEDQFIEGALQGDQHALKQLIELHQDYVFSICLSILKNRMDAEEAAQDTFIKVFKSLKSFNKQSKFSTWLYQIAYRSSIDLLRKQKHTEDIEVIDYKMTASREDNQQAIETKELKQNISKILTQLPEDERAIITLYYLKEYSIKEVVDIVGLSESNVKVKLYRARKKMYMLLTANKELF